MLNLRKVADDADMIVNGYAFNKCSHGYRVLNLNKPQNAIVFSKSGEILETTMDDIEIAIVKDYLNRNKKLLEE